MSYTRLKVGDIVKRNKSGMSNNISDNMWYVDKRSSKLSEFIIKSIDKNKSHDSGYSIMIVTYPGNEVFQGCYEPNYFDLVKSRKSHLPEWF